MLTMLVQTLKSFVFIFLFNNAFWPFDNQYSME